MEKTYWPELGDGVPDNDMIAEYGFGGLYNVKTALALKTPGLKFRDEHNGIKRYLATEKTLKKLSALYRVARPLYLD